MLGHSSFNDDYELQTLQENESLLAPDILDEINAVVIEGGTV
jgi:hypothetical protein